MKRTLLECLPEDVPAEFVRFAAGAPIYDSSCSPEARVWLIDRDGGYYLKKNRAGELSREAEMTAYFHKKGLGAEVLAYRTDEHDWLLTASVRGEDCTLQKYLDEPKRLADVLAESLRALHEINPSDCPVTDRCGEYIALAEANYRSGCYSKEHFPDSFGYRSAEEAYAVFSEGKSALICDTLLHGDYCLPNIMLDNWSFSAFIDVGMGGVGERHIDLFWGAWTLLFNLKTDRYRERFFDAYGRDKVDTDIIRVIAAAEVYRGKVIDYTTNEMCIEVTGDPSKIDAFIKLMIPFGIIEMCRTGIVALDRGNVNLLGK